MASLAVNTYEDFKQVALARGMPIVVFTVIVRSSAPNIVHLAALKDDASVFVGLTATLTKEDILSDFPQAIELTGDFTIL